MDLIGFASEIIEISDENRYLKIEVARLKKVETEYLKLLKSSIDHSAAMMHNLVGEMLKNHE